MKITVQTYYFAGSERILTTIGGGGQPTVPTDKKLEIITRPPRPRGSAIATSKWSVQNVTPIYDKNGNISEYSGTVYLTKRFWLFRGRSINTGITVKSGISIDSKGNISSNKIWTSRQYEMEKELGGEK